MCGDREASKRPLFSLVSYLEPIVVRKLGQKLKIIHHCHLIENTGFLEFFSKRKPPVPSRVAGSAV
jgi:hypothetical protein